MRLGVIYSVRGRKQKRYAWLTDLVTN